MSETSTIQNPMRGTIADPPAPDVQPNIRLNEGPVPKLGRWWRGEQAAPTPTAMKPKTEVTQEEQLAQLRTRVDHYVKQLAAARLLMDDTPRPAIGGDVIARQRDYVRRLDSFEDLAAMPWTDLGQLAGLLERPGGEGLIALTLTHITQLESAIALPAKEAEAEKLREKAISKIKSLALRLAGEIRASQHLYSFPVGLSFPGMPNDLLAAFARRMEHTYGRAAIERAVSSQQASDGQPAGADAKAKKK